MTRPAREPVVLVADARASGRTSVRRLLSDRPYRFAEADTADAAILAACDPAGAPHCLILDAQLSDPPGRSGDPARVLAALTDADGLPICPVVVLADAVDPEAALAALRAGAQDYLGKEGLTPAALTHAVTCAVERWRKVRELCDQKAALQQREDRLALAFGAADLLYFSWDVSTDRVERRLSHLPSLPSTGDRPGKFDDVVQVVHPDDRASFVAKVRAALASGSRYRNRYRLRDGAGPTTWIEDTGRVIRDARGEAVRLVGVARDVTERERATERLSLLLAVSRAALEAPAADASLSERVIGPVAAHLGADVLLHVRSERGVVRFVVGVGAPEDLARAELRLPLLGRDGRTLGSVAAASGRGGFAPDEVEFLQTVCGFLALAWDRQEAEDALRRSEERLRLAVEAADTGLWEWDLRTDAVVWSPECYCIHGLAEADFDGTGAGFFQLVHPDDRARVERTVRGAIAADTLYECEFRILRPPGDAVWVTNRGRASYGEDGQPVRVLGTLTDISDRKRAQEALEASERRLRLLLDHQFQFTALLGADMRVLEVSESALRQSGVSKAEILGQPFLDTPWWRGLPEAQAHWRTRFAEAVARPTPARGEAAFRDANGGLRHALTTATAARNDDGEIECLLAEGIDITDRKRAEEELVRSERFARSVVEASADCVEGLTPDGRLLWMNESGQRLFEVADFEAVRGRPWAAFWEAEGQRRAAEAAMATALAGGIGRFRGFSATMAGTPRWWDVAITPIPGPEGAVEQLLCVSRDVTDARVAERALQEQDRRKDEFLATLAHELRNPLAPIGNGLAILRLGGASAGPGPTARVLEMMGRQLGHLVHLVDDLLDVSRVSQGKIALRRERLPIAEVVEAAVEACRPTIDAKRHALTVELPDVPLVVRADRTRIVQVVNNLITNAAKYSDAGGQITVRVDREGDEAVVRVADGGVGIAPGALPALFDLFSQVRDTLDKAQGGLGIGLFLVRKIVELHGGRVSADSPGPGRGSTFTVRLPLLDPADRPGDTPPPADPRPEQIPAGRRVLIVDDNVDAAESLALILALHGHGTSVVHNGPDALDVARTFRPEVVFLDIGLPGMDGYAVARRLREDPPGERLTLVALTGWGSEDDKRRSREAGFDHHLTKPVEAGAVQALLSGVR